MTMTVSSEVIQSTKNDSSQIDSPTKIKREERQINNI